MCCSSHCEVRLTPFSQSELGQGISPTKVYKYLATGLPVVALHWGELEIENLPVILAIGEDEFSSGIEKALHITESEKADMGCYAINFTRERRLRKVFMQSA